MVPADDGLGPGGGGSELLVAGSVPVIEMVVQEPREGKPADGPIPPLDEELSLLDGPPHGRCRRHFQAVTEMVLTRPWGL